MTDSIPTLSPQNGSSTNALAGQEVREDISSTILANSSRDLSEKPFEYTLSDAIKNDDLQGVKFLMERERISCSSYSYGWALRQAAEEGRLEIVQYLIECLKDYGLKFLPEERHQNPSKAKILHRRIVNGTWGVGVAIDEAINNSHTRIVAYLLSQGAGKFSQVLGKVAKTGNIEMVRHLVEKRSDFTRINKGSLDVAAYEAVLNGHLEILKYLVEQGADIHASHAVRYSSEENLLTAASRLGNIEIAKYLVGQGADIHAQKDDALCEAATQGHFDIVKYLVGQGADIHVLEERALYGALRCGHMNVAKYLVEQGADIHVDKERALIDASLAGNLEAVKYLVSHGTNIQAQDERALKYACSQGFLPIVKYLVQQEMNDTRRNG